MAAKSTGKVPAEEETDKLKAERCELETRRARLGGFSGKEKKRITGEIAAIDAKLDSLKKKIKEELAARKAKTAPLKEKEEKLRRETKETEKRISAIEATLNSVPQKIICPLFRTDIKGY